MSDAIKVKAPAFAFFLSILFPGLGQLYAGRTRSGFGFILLGIITLLSIWILIGWVLYPLTCIISAILAYRGANKANAQFRDQLARYQTQKP